MEPIRSRVLEGNPWGDPTERRTACYLPPSGRTEGLPLLVLLAGYTGAGWMQFREGGYLQEALHQRIDRMMRTGACGEAVIVAPDCLTKLGGSQYVNSSATGRYADHIVQEVVPWARERFHTDLTGVLGQSSGGFGALHLAFEHPEVFSAVGSSSGDMAFEHCYLPDFPKALRQFRKYGGPEEFLRKLFEEPSKVLVGPLDPSGAALNTLGMASCYSPISEEPGSFELPFDLETGLLRSEVWERWLAFDPLRRVRTDAGARALAGLRRLHITASTPDEWALDVGARGFAAEARAREVPVLHEELEGGHFQSGPRYERLFSELISALRPG